MYRIKGFRRVVILCSLVFHTLSKSSHKPEITVRKKLIIYTNKKKKINPNSYDQAQSRELSTRPQVTIWLHGTKSMSFISDFVHAAPRKGLMPIAQIPRLYRIKSVIESLARSDHIRFPIEHIYTYGWSGKLCFKKRKKEALGLYHSLIDLVNTYQKKYGIAPHITLITHSHGGNVALNLATVENRDTSLRLDLVLLACPVQHETKHLIEDPLFNRIYSFYSPADLMQIIDPQGLYFTQSNPALHFELSERIFPIHPSIRQTCLEINGNGVSHLGFILESTMEMLPTLLDTVEMWEHEEPSQTGKERILDITTIQEHATGL